MPTRLRQQGQTPLLSSSGIIDYINEKKVSGPGVVTGRSGSIGNVFFIEQDFWPLNTALYVKEFFENDPKFIYHLLNQMGLQRYATGAGVPTLNRNHVHTERVWVPTNSSMQKDIVKKIDLTIEQVEKAMKCYEDKKINLGELKQSILQKAFSSELTAKDIAEAA